MSISKENQQHIKDLEELDERERLIDRAFDGFFAFGTIIGYVYLSHLIGFKVIIVFLMQYTGYRFGRSSSK